MKIGVLGLQGDVRDHAAALHDAGATPVIVKRVEDLSLVDALVLPGGESTTIGKLLARYGLLDPIRARARGGLPMYGTCAGLILMASEVVGQDAAPHRLAVLDVAVTRNAYGRQVDSFEADVEVGGWAEPFSAVFIRSPVIERTGDDVEVLANFDDRPVLVKQDRMLASTFHPEMTADPRVHRMFVELAES
jgi:5'-phosphate synthase pdxT subunit